MLMSNTLPGRALAAVGDARNALEGQLSASLQVFAKDSGWPYDVVRSLSVTHGDEGFEISIPDSHRARVLDLEYGTQHSAPTAVLRRFERRAGELVSGDVFLETVGGVL